MRSAIAAAATLAILGLLAYRALRVGPSVPEKSVVVASGEPGVEHPAAACVGRLLDAGKAGDVEAYLEVFGGPLRERLERERREQGDAALSRSLVKSALARKGHARYAPEADGPGVFRVLVESVYSEFNECQTYRVEESGGRWKVTGVDRVRSLVPVSRYGEAATFEGPEGVPVPADDRAPASTGSR
jgi:hypothetical protein